jgi:hypothetical protein
MTKSIPAHSGDGLLCCFLLLWEYFAGFEETVGTVLAVNVDGVILLKRGQDV